MTTEGETPQERVPLHDQVAQRFGLLPNFFRLAPESPDITLNLWGFARFGYLDNPLPSLFKERLFVYLSRFCDVQYCIARHVGFLVGLGHPSGDEHCPPQTAEDVIRLLRRPLPRGEELAPYLVHGLSGSPPVSEIPAADSPLETALFVCSAHVFLQTLDAPASLAMLKAVLGNARLEQLLVLLAFIRTAHYWTKVHPELTMEDDVQQLLSANEALADRLRDDAQAASCELNEQLRHELRSLRDEKGRHDALVQAHEALRDSEARLSGLIQSTMDAVVTVDADQHIVLFNPAAERMFGYKAADVLGLPVDRFLSQSLPQMHRRRLEEFHRTGAPSRRMSSLGYWSGTRANGEQFPIEASISNVTVENQRLFTVILRDITDRRKAEDSLAESQQRLRLATEAAQLGIWEWNVMTNQIRWDAHMFRLYGVEPTADGLVSYQTWRDAVLPEDLPEQERILQDTARGGRSARSFRIRRASDGALRHIEAVETFRTNAQGENEWVVGTNIDVTERRQAEAALHDSEQRLRFSMSAGRLGSWQWDVRTGECIWNREHFEFLGLSPSVDGKTHLDSLIQVIHPDDRAGMQEELEQALVERRPYQPDFRIMRADNGAIRWMAGRGEYVYDEAGGALYSYGVIMDITERRQAEAQLRDAQARMHQWNVELEQAVKNKTAELTQSHDRLRALATELNLAEQRERKRLATELHDHLQQMLVLGKFKMGTYKRFAETVPAAATLMKETDEVLSEALTYTRTLVADLSPPVLREHGLSAGLQWLAESLTKHDLEVNVILPPVDRLNLPEDQAVLLFQSVRELLLNSAKHAQTGRATVRLSTVEQELRIAVRDEGVGFDPTSTARREEMASKFGLFSIKERMKALGGSFDIVSAPGEGTTATLALPLPRFHAEAEKGPTVRDENSAGMLDQNRGLAIGSDGRSGQTGQPSRTRVLLVDDHVMVRQGLRAILDNYPDIDVVGEAIDGEDAVRQVSRLQPAVVVMDINMPKKNGIDATKDIMSRWPGTVVVGLSVNAGSDAHRAMLGAGAARLLTKEAAVEQLYDAIQEVSKR